jgi:hypothetical protein
MFAVTLPVGFLPDHFVALTAHALQPWRIRHRDTPTGVADNPEILKVACGFGHTFAPHAEHVRDELLRHGQCSAWQPIQGEQQSAAELLVETVVPVADRGLGYLRQQRLRIAQQKTVHLSIAVKLFLDASSQQPKRVAGASYDYAARGGVTAHEQSEAEDAIVTHR